MSRKKVLSGGKKDEIIESALHLFMEYGFEQTSIRMILKEVNGEVGMFYYYFKSKHELFDAVVQYYMDKYVEDYRNIAEDSNKNLFEQLGDMAELLKKAGMEYAMLMKEQNMHWTVQHALHERTLKSLEPYMTIILKKGIEDGIAHNVLGLDIDTLSSCIIHGIDGILHVHDETGITSERIRQTEEDVYKYLGHMININLERVNAKNGENIND